MTLINRVKRIVQLLDQEYQSADVGNKPDSIEALVFILLSQKTTKAKCVEIVERLKRSFDSWEGVRDADEKEIASIIHPAGMAARRAKLIKATLGAITKTYGSLDLSGVRALGVAKGIRQLMELPGINNCAARSILLYCFGKNVLPVDMQTYRIAIRLGLLSRTVSYEESQYALDAIIPWNLRRKFHVNAEHHGRSRCKAQSPRCEGCPLVRMCVVAKSKSEPHIVIRPRPLALELFSGAGGMSHGFGQAGFAIVQAIEKDKRAADTFKTNHARTNLIVGDVSDLAPLEIAGQVSIRKGDLTAIFGGPPCQGFSESNRRTRTLDNPRNHLYQQFFRYVKALAPQWFVLENVAGIKSLANGAVLDAIIARSRELGYIADWRELNAADFGVPQTRRRIFVVGNRIGVAIKFPSPTHGSVANPYVTVSQAISDLPVLRAGANEGCLNYRTSPPATSYQLLMRNGDLSVDGNLVTNNSELIVSRYKHIRQGQNWEAIPQELMDNYFDASRCHTGIYYRLKQNEPSKVIGNFRKNMLIHPSQNRGLSVREAARLQSFPDSYKFVGSIGFQQQQVADAVPPLLAEAVARAVLASMDRKNNDE